MGKYLGSTGLTYFWGKIKAAFATKEEVSTKADTADVLIPNFDGMTPIKVIEFDKSAATWSQLFTRKNTGISTTMSEVQDVVLMRITVTGTNIYSRSDVVIKFQPGLVNPHAYAFHHTYSTSAGTTGLQYLRFNYPKALNNNIPWMGDFYQFNVTARHYKIEVFATTENITWTESLTATTYNSTDYSTAQMTLYANRGLVWLGTPVVYVTNANSASYINAYQNKYTNSTPIKAGEALVTYDIAFHSNGFAYKIGNKNVAIDPEYGICSIGTSYSANGNIGYAYHRTVWSFTFTSPAGHGLTYPAFVQGDKAYLRCTMKDGKIYSDAYLAKEMAPGYTWYLLGAMYNNANGLAMNTEGSMFITLDDAGFVSYINGRPTQAALMTDGVDQENTFLKRSGTPAGNAVVKEVRGNSIVWNQQVSTYTKWSSTITGTIDNLTMLASARYGRIQFTFGGKHLGPDIFVTGSNYYISVEVKATSNLIRVGAQNSAGAVGGAGFPYKDHSGSGEWERFSFVVTGGSVSSSYIGFVISDMRTSDWDNVYIKNAMYLNLTKMFGAGNEPSNVERIEKLFPEPYYEYDASTLLNLEMTSIRTEDSSSADVDNITFNVKTIQGVPSGGSTAETIFPNGMCGIGSVQDEIDFEDGKAIKRFGVVDLGNIGNYGTAADGRFYNNYIKDLVQKPSATNIVANIMNVTYSVYPDNTLRTNTSLVGIGIGGDGYIYVRDSQYSTATDFKAAMSGNLLYYELAEPIEYIITAAAPTYITVRGGVEKILPYDDDSILTAPISAKIYYSNNIDSKVANKQDKIAIINHGTSDTTYTLSSNALHVWGTINSLTLSLPNSSTTYVDGYWFKFTAGDSFTALTMPNGVVWAAEPEIEAGKTYEVFIVNNLATYITEGIESIYATKTWVQNNIHIPVTRIVAASGSTLSAVVNTIYTYSSAVTSLAITLPSIEDATKAEAISFILTTGTSPTISFSSADSVPVLYHDGYSIEEDTMYELNAMFIGNAWIVGMCKITTT